MGKPVVVLDRNERPVEPGNFYRLCSGGNALIVQITQDGEHFVAVPSFFAGFFGIEGVPTRLDNLAAHCSFLPESELPAGPKNEPLPETVSVVVDLPLESYLQIEQLSRVLFKSIAHAAALTIFTGQRIQNRVYEDAGNMGGD